MSTTSAIRRTDAFVTADGTELHIEESGAAKAAATLVLVHGWTQDCRTWDPVQTELGDTGCRVLRYDLRGHGGSSPAAKGTATIEQLADDLAELLAHRVPSGPVVLAGHSMGGMTIMALAARHPELVAARVAGVAFVATACGEMDQLTLGLPGRAGNAAVRIARQAGEWLAAMQRERVPLRPALARSGARALVFGKRPRRSDVAVVADQLLRANPANLGEFQQAIAAHDQRAALFSLRETPAAVLVGDRDRLCPISRARAIADELPDAEYVLLPGAGHMLPQERAGEVAARIARLVPVS